MEKLSCFTLLLLLSNFCGFASSNISVIYNAPSYANEQTYLLEGCQGGTIQMTRPNDLFGNVQFNIVCTGNTTIDADYNPIALQWTLNAEFENLFIPIEAVYDQENENSEWLNIDISCVQDPEFYYHLELEIRDVLPITDYQIPLEIYCDQDAQLELNISGGSGIYTVEWSTQEVGNPYLIVDPTPGTITYTITDACDAVEMETGAAEISFIPYPAIEFAVGPDITLNCTQDLAIEVQPTGGNGNYTYQWYINGNPNAYNTDASFLWTDPATSTISLVVTDECNSAQVDEMNVIIFNPLPTIDIGSDIVGNCLDQTTVNAAVTGGIGSSVITWYYNDMPIGEGNLINLAIANGGELYAEAVDVCGSTGTAIVEVVQQPEPVHVLIDPIFGMCQDQLPVTAQVSGGVGSAFTYVWSAQGSVVSTESTAMVIALPNEMVSLTATDVCGNSATHEVPIVLNVQEIDVAAMETLIASNCDQTWQVNAPAVNGGTGNYNYTWHVAENSAVLATTSVLNVDVTGLNGSYLYVEVTDECTNYGVDSILIQIDLPPVQTDLATEYVFGCLENIVLQPTVSGGAAPYTYSWQIDDTEVSEGAIYNAQATLSQNVVCLVTDHCGISAASPVHIEVSPTNLSAEIIASDDTVCPNQDLDLLVVTENLIGEAIFEWSTGHNSEQISYRANQNQILECEVRDVCGNVFTAEYNLAIIPSTGDFLVMDDMMLCHGYESGALANGGFLPYTYSFTSEALASAENGVIAKGTSEVTVMVSDACGHSGQLTIDARSCDFIIPNVFTPNNDSKNDTFEINGLEKFPQSVLIVFDRDGRKVFESKDYKNDWRADDLPSGQYFYVLRRNDGETFESSVAVLR